MNMLRLSTDFLGRAEETEKDINTLSDDILGHCPYQTISFRSILPLFTEISAEKQFVPQPASSRNSVELLTK